MFFKLFLWVQTQLKHQPEKLITQIRFETGFSFPLTSTFRSYLDMGLHIQNSIGQGRTNSELTWTWTWVWLEQWGLEGDSTVNVVYYKMKNDIDKALTDEQGKHRASLSEKIIYLENVTILLTFWSIFEKETANWKYINSRYCPEGFTICKNTNIPLTLFLMFALCPCLAHSPFS